MYIVINNYILTLLVRIYIYIYTYMHIHIVNLEWRGVPHSCKAFWNIYQKLVGEWLTKGNKIDKSSTIWHA